MNTRKKILRMTQKKVHVPGSRLLEKAAHSFSKKEKIVFFSLFAVLIASTALLLFRVNTSLLVEIPLKGGTIIEGVVGTTPPKINPVATSPFTSPATENDLISLIYSGLMHVGPDGNLEPNLAESYSISEDGLVYTFELKKGLIWHDGTPLTSEDVAFTIQKIQDPQVNSRNTASWDGVVVDTPNAHQVTFTLSEPYSPFLQNTTIGIIPKHLWQNVHPENFATDPLNTNPTGSGPYTIEKVKTNKDGTVEYYELHAFEHYALGEPYVQKIRIQFYSHEEDMIEAYESGEITSMSSISSKEASNLEENQRIERINLPRIFSAFFNQNEAEIFTLTEVRQALNVAIDREEIITEVLHGFATEIQGPIPPGSLGYSPAEETALASSTQTKIEYAQSILENAGWEKDEDGIYIKETKEADYRLEFSISTTQEAPELYAAAQILERTWSELGANIDLKTFETKGDLENEAIRPRGYDVLLFGEIIGVNSDPYAFWHSSQRLDPGLNIASYTNITVDAVLEKARTTTDEAARIEYYKTFQEEIYNDTPAVFLYAPQLIYATRENINGINISVVNTPSERFSNIHTWFLKTEKVWKVFAKDTPIVSATY